MSAEILTITPTSGNAPEIHFGEHFSHPLWIEFVNNDSEKWFGCFSSDYPSVLNKVLVDKENKSAFVVSGGIGYLVDINNMIVKHKTEDHPLIESLIQTNDPDYFIAGTFYSIYVFDTDKFIQEISPNMTIDGIYFKNQIGRKATGDLASAENQYESNLDFEFDLDTFELTLNQKVIRKDYKVFETIRVVDKNWTEKPNMIRRLIDKLKN